MEIDGGPPPFIGVVDKNPHDPDEHDVDDVYDDVDSSPDSSNLPLPSDPNRSRSVTPVEDVTQIASTISPKHEEENCVDDNDKGDTMHTAVSQNDWSSEFQTTSGKEEVKENEMVEEDDDEWGDFGEVVAAALIQRSPQQPPPPLQMSNLNAAADDDDDWGAFDQARPSTDRSEDVTSNPSSARSQEARQLAHQQSLEEWGAFEAPKSELNGGDGDDEDDEWQAEFSSAAVTTTKPFTAPDMILENLKILEEMLDDDTFWDDGYSEENQEQDPEPTDAIDIPSLFDAESLVEMSNEFVDEKKKYSKLWLSLRVIEEAISLKFDWKQSEIRKNHFKSLKINPITVKKETRATAAAIFDTSNLLLPTPIQHQSSSESHDLKTSSSSTPSVDSPSVPAVDFDWDTSGLTNPMNRANQSSAIIDVDFLSTNGVATAYTSTLQKDLEQFGLNGVKTTAASSNGSTILETLMSQANGTAGGANHHGHRYRTPEVLSLDARKLLERLPDLQYLQSEVLMFPVGTNLPH